MKIKMKNRNSLCSDKNLSVYYNFCTVVWISQIVKEAKIYFKMPPSQQDVGTQFSTRVSHLAVCFVSTLAAHLFQTILLKMFV